MFQQEVGLTMSMVGNLKISEPLLGILEKFVLVLSSDLPHIISFLPPPPADEVCEGYVFTGVCLSTEGGGHAW